MKIDIIVGTRPNFIKSAILLKEIDLRVKNNVNYDVRLIHTGQHFDKKLSKEIFVDLEIREPDVKFNLSPGSINHITSEIILNYNRVLEKKKPDICLVFGDVTSTMACAIAAKRFNIKVAHVEAGLRSFDNSMPEEINRLITDSISDYLFTTTENAVQNLKKNYNGFGKIFFVGNVMIDTLIYFQSKISRPKFFNELNLEKSKYLILTLHRPSNVDDIEILSDLLKNICDAASSSTILFPVHPRTRKVLEKIDIQNQNLKIVEPFSYLDFIYFLKNSIGIITDSGGITEEATFLKIPCITMRENTERPETCEVGTNLLIGNGKNIQLLIESTTNMVNQKWKKSNIPDLWDGKASARILDILEMDFK